MARFGYHEDSEMWLPGKGFPLLCAVALLLFSAEGKMIGPGMSGLNPAAGLFSGGVSPYLGGLRDWRPLGAVGPLTVQTSVISVAWYADIDPLPAGGEFMAGNGMFLLLTLCR